MIFSLAMCILGHIAIDLGTAGVFKILGFATVTNTGPTIIDGGSVGTAGSSVTGFGGYGGFIVPPGTIITGEYATSSAFTDANTAFTEVANLPYPAMLMAELGGMTLPPGVYTFGSTAQLTGTLTLEGTGADDDEWFFQIPSSLTTGSATDARILMTKGGQGCNVWWKVGSSATIGVGTLFVGNILAKASVSLLTGAAVDGVAVGLTAQVSLDTNIVYGEDCGARVSSSVTGLASSAFTTPLSTADFDTTTTIGGGGDGGSSDFPTARPTTELTSTLPTIPSTELQPSISRSVFSYSMFPSASESEVPTPSFFSETMSGTAVSADVTRSSSTLDTTTEFLTSSSLSSQQATSPSITTERGPLVTSLFSTMEFGESSTQSSLETLLITSSASSTESEFSTIDTLRSSLSTLSFDLSTSTFLDSITSAPATLLTSNSFVSSDISRTASQTIDVVSTTQATEAYTSLSTSSTETSSGCVCEQSTEVFYTTSTLFATSAFGSCTADSSISTRYTTSIDFSTSTLIFNSTSTLHTTLTATDYSTSTLFTTATEFSSFGDCTALSTIYPSSTLTFYTTETETTTFNTTQILYTTETNTLYTYITNSTTTTQTLTSTSTVLIPKTTTLAFTSTSIDHTTSTITEKSTIGAARQTITCTETEIEKIWQTETCTKTEVEKVRETEICTVTKVVTAEVKKGCVLESELVMEAEGYRVEDATGKKDDYYEEEQYESKAEDGKLKIAYKGTDDTPSTGKGEHEENTNYNEDHTTSGYDENHKYQLPNMSAEATQPKPHAAINNSPSSPVVAEYSPSEGSNRTAATTNDSVSPGPLYKETNVAIRIDGGRWLGLCAALVGMILLF